MQIAKHWVRARVTRDGVPTDDPDAITSLGWSDRSIEDALKVGFERAKRAAVLLSGRKGFISNDYPYPDRPIREEIVERLEQGGRLVAAITRNSYGSLVLNTASLMFIDIDTPQPTLGRRLRKWFSKNSEPTHEDVVAQQLHRLTREQRGLGLRLYRTAAGLRVAVTNRPMDPQGREAHQLMQLVEADPQYAQLCRKQACFRARLTAKPWRCGLDRLPVVFPYETEVALRTFEQWSQQYDQAAAGCAACERVEDFGSTTVHVDIQRALQWHDDLACRAGAKLA